MSLTNLSPSIPEFFAGKNIFITGATGFLGKALIEKLLRSCPKIGDIYVLIRPKKGKTLEERLQILTSDLVFERVKSEQSNLDMDKKIIPLAGDVQQINLGLSPEDRLILIENINIIFHVAASVRFDDPLQDAVLMNVRGTREICQLALDTKNIVAHLHISTAFVNCDRSEVKEMLYPAKMDWKQLIEIAEKFDRISLKALTEKILNGMPNTYCFTKNVAEHVTYDLLEGRVPCKIFRPSIVVSSMKAEPVPGWIDNFNGPVGICIAIGKGIMRTLYAPLSHKPDYIPVDIVTKALIISTWDLALRASVIPEVLHATAYDTKWLRVSTEQFGTGAIYINNHVLPLNGAAWYPVYHRSKTVTEWYLRTIFCMVLPSIFADVLLKLAGKKPMLMKFQKKIFIVQNALRYFMFHEWDYQNDNLLALKKLVLKQDFADWDLEFQEFGFYEFFFNTSMGARKYLLKEPDSTIESAKKHLRRMFWLDRFVKVLFFGLFLWVIWKYWVGKIPMVTQILRL